jgi:type I restriction enzyme, S subunit
MDTATFFENFSLFAQAEDAATRFREVVLNLAFSGKLKGTDLSGWETHPIGDFFTEGLKSINAPESPNQTYELWSVPSFETGAPEIVTGAQVGSTKRELRDGTILLGKINPHLNRIWVVNRRTNHPMIASQEWINVTAGDKWDTGYLARLLSSPSFNRSVCATAQGMGSLTRANTKQVAQIMVHCPPLKEQQKLIAKVDELMALCDRLEALLKECDVKQAALAKAALAKFTEDPTPENLQLLFHPSFSIATKDLRELVLNLAINGRLGTQNPDDESAKLLLARINATRTTMLKDGYPNRDEASTQLRKQEAQAIPEGLRSIPPGWAWATLLQTSLLIVDCHNKTAPYVEKGVHLLRTTNIREGRLNLNEAKYVTNETYERWSARCKPEPGDLIITREAPMGEACIIPEGMKVCLGQRMMLIRLVPGTFEDSYLLYTLMAADLMERVQDKPVGATVQHLRVGGVETLLTPIPPLAEQQRIVKRVNQLIAQIDQLEAQIEASRTTGEKLLEAMVAELTSA